MAFRIDQQSSLEFEIVQMLDAGHSSEIHLAQCTENRDWQVAIKRCRTDSQNVDDWLVQVEREISALHHLNTAETPDWSFEMSLQNRLNYTYSTVDKRFIIQLISVFDIDGLPAIALEIAPPSITNHNLDRYTLSDVMYQLAQATLLVHDRGTAFTDFDPLIKIPRIRWDDEQQRIKIIDWNITRETEDYKRRDIIYLGRIFFQLMTGYPAWAKIEPQIDYLPNKRNEYALDVTGASIDKWYELESAIRHVIERLMIEDESDAITDAEQLLDAMDWVKQLSDLSKRIEAGSATAMNEMEDLLHEASNAHPPQLRHIVDIGSFWTKVAPESRLEPHRRQIESSSELLKTAHLDRIARAMDYLHNQQYSDVLAELENARSRATSNQTLAQAIDYRYIVAQIAEEVEAQNLIDVSELKDLIDKLVTMVGGLESRLWAVDEAEQTRDDIKQSFPTEIISMPLMQSIFEDIEASKLFATQIHAIHANQRQTHIDQNWHVREANRLDKFNQTIIPNLEKVEQLSLVKSRVTRQLEQIRETITADQKDLEMVQRFLGELSRGVTSIDIEGYLARSTLDRPYAPLTIDKALLPRDRSDLSADEVYGDAIERYEAFREQWDTTMSASITVREKLTTLSTMVVEHEDMIELFREKLPTITIPGETAERKTVYKDLEDLTQFVNAVDAVYDELGSIGLNRIPNINNIQKKWVFVTNVQDPALRQFVTAIEANLASHTHDKVRDKSLPPELAMLVYEMIDVPIPTEVMQIGQEIQLHKYVRDTLRQSTNRLQSAEDIETVIGELNRLTARNLGELDDAIRQLLIKLEQFLEAMRARTIVRQIRTLYRVTKRKTESENKDIQAFAEQIDSAVNDVIDKKVHALESALDKAKTNESLSREEEVLVRDTHRVIDTLRHNNLLQERRWHHVQNSQAYLLREHARTLEQTTINFNEFKFAEAKKHIDRAFQLAQLFDTPYDKRLPGQLQTADDMVQQFSQHFTMTRGIDTVRVDDIEKLLNDELTFWNELHEIVNELSLQAASDDTLAFTFDVQNLEMLIAGLRQAQTITNAMQNVRNAIDRLREFEQTIQQNNLSVLVPLHTRLQDLVQYNYTQVLSRQIREIEEIASGQRIISNESVIKRLSTGYMLIDLNKQLDILDMNESNRRQRQLQTNTYTTLKNIQPKNRDERQALAEFIESLPPREVFSRDFQGVLAHLAEDPGNYAYLVEQVHTMDLPNFQTGGNRQMRRTLLIVTTIAVIVMLIALVLSGSLPIEGFTLPGIR